MTTTEKIATAMRAIITNASREAHPNNLPIARYDYDWSQSGTAIVTPENAEIALRYASRYDGMNPADVATVRAYLASQRGAR